MRPKTITADQLAALLKPGMRVFVQGSVGQPVALLRAIAEAESRVEGIHFVSPLTPGLNGFDIGGDGRGNRLTSFFNYPALGEAWTAGRVDFVPSHYSRISDWLKATGPIDIALIQLAPPDAAGLCSTGLSADFMPDLLPHCDCVVAQINPAMPDLPGAPKIALDALDYSIFIEEGLPVQPVPKGDAISDAIAGHVASIVNDGDTIQFGVGRVPQLAVAGLHGKADLGLHSGLITPVVRPLIESGVLSGKRKNVDTGLHVTGAVSGDADFYEWITARTDFAIRPVSYTHAHATLSSIDNLVAINSAIAVDLFGQANAEMAGSRQISGSGGLVDFVRGATSAAGGRSIICLPATSRDGTRSNIVSRLNSVVTICRTDIDIVITEYGVARLRLLPLAERAQSLIAIAAPAFRQSLAEQWQRSATG
ncbi:acetyl-CoA hydrolase/transferase family protein [Parasphingorhabdus sp.]|uniref:acetyl-CoA hydrolase/transferase family protein n=1 Tax=Parasphingorhabdus sp. TaxID=2709688 RepID=UPI002B27423F|nr:acetyl-CoA hydrolase/transferase C-terminal domain-containing protein [Parasphingorhabdus sp.]